MLSVGLDGRGIGDRVYTQNIYGYITYALQRVSHLREKIYVEAVMSHRVNMQAVGFTECTDNEERTSKVRSKPKATLFSLV